MMLNIDGIEVCKRIREFSNIPIPMLSAKAEDMEQLKSIVMQQKQRLLLFYISHNFEIPIFLYSYILELLYVYFS